MLLQNWFQVSTHSFLGKDDSDYLAFKETTWSYSKFVYRSTCLCEPVPLHSQPIQICCPRMKICKRNYNMYIFILLLTLKSLLQYLVKGQLISKGLFGILNSSKKRMKKFDLTTMIPQVDLFLFVFWKNLKTPKRHLEINWPLARSQYFCHCAKFHKPL